MKKMTKRFFCIVNDFNVNINYEVILKSGFDMKKTGDDQSEIDFVCS